jgi:hypothetical protein
LASFGAGVANFAGHTVSTTTTLAIKLADGGPYRPTAPPLSVANPYPCQGGFYAAGEIFAGIAVSLFDPEADIPGVAEELTAAAGRAVETVGPGNGAVYGTQVHGAFEAEVAALSRGDITTEVSYLAGRIVPRGTAGSVRLDVVEGAPTTPTAIYDLKTGSASLTPGRIAQIRSQLPPGYQNIPVQEIRP